MITLDANRSIRNLSSFTERFPVAAARAAVLAVNEAARFGRAQSVREMRKQVRLTAKYVRDNLTITERASPNNAQATITGRRRPTSLARYVVGVPRRGRPLRIKVHPNGSTVSLRGAYIARLRSGSSGDQDNRGLAIRIKPGNVLNRGKGKLLREDKYGKTYLLYSASVDQVFRSVRDDVSPAIEDRLGSEFVRQFARFTT